MTRLTVVGFGLIGGSLALAARKARPEVRIVAIDSPEVLAQDAARSASDTRIQAGDDDAVARALGDSTLTVLAAPVRVICARVAQALERAPVVTDCGSTKREVLARARKAPRWKRFVPGHPMAGRPEGGIEHASVDLFRDRTWILCPGDADPDAVEAVTTLVRSVGARPELMSVEEHDALVARTSHVPQLLASALSLLGGSGAERASGPAFERATRVAGGPESMWRDIFATNGDEVARALGELLDQLGPVAESLGRRETGLADELLARARRARRGSGDGG